MLTIAQRRILAVIGHLGGKARKLALTPEQRSAIARKAGKAPKRKRNGKLKASK